jgi:hypothetical protein
LKPIRPFQTSWTAHGPADLFHHRRRRCWRHQFKFMNKTTLSDYLVISRGQWDQDLSPETIQAAIDQFYIWHDRLVAEGKLVSGQRLATEGKLVTKRAVMDGPFAEATEVIGGYWFFRARSLDEAAALAIQNPCLACGLSFEVRPMESERASAFKVTNETPVNRRTRK